YPRRTRISRVPSLLVQTVNLHRFDLTSKEYLVT
ncbi:MAG: hypothetical protein ACI8VI_000471, partial [Granulosicoccus sp.]